MSKKFVRGTCIVVIAVMAITFAVGSISMFIS